MILIAIIAVVVFIVGIVLAMCRAASLGDELVGTYKRKDTR